MCQLLLSFLYDLFGAFMRFLFALIALLSTICINTETKPLALDKPGQIESVIFVNGKARKKRTTASAKQKSTFSREKYSQKTARLIEVVSPNVLRVDNSGRQERSSTIRFNGYVSQSARQNAG